MDDDEISKLADLHSDITDTEFNRLDKRSQDELSAGFSKRNKKINTNGWSDTTWAQADYQGTHNTPGMQYTGSHGVGKSVYDVYETPSEANAQNNENTRSLNQPIYAKLASGLGKLATSGTATFIDGVVSLAYSLPTAIYKGIKTNDIEQFGNAFMNNDITNEVDKAQKNLEEDLPNYKSNWENDHQFRSMFTTANGWADLLAMTGFTIGSIYGAMPYARILSTISKLGKIGKFAASAVTDVVMTSGEAAMEGKQNSEQWLDFQIGKVRDKYDSQMQELEMQEHYASTPGELARIREQKDRLTQARDASINEARADKIHVQTMDFALNYPILMASNAITFGRQMANGFRSDKRMAEIIADREKKEFETQVGKGYGRISESLNDEVNKTGGFKALRDNNGLAYLVTKNGEDKFFDAGGKEITADVFKKLQSTAANDPTKAYNLAYDAAKAAGKTEREAIGIGNTAKKEADRLLKENDIYEQAAVKRYGLKKVENANPFEGRYKAELDKIDKEEADQLSKVKTRKPGETKADGATRASGEVQNIKAEFEQKRIDLKKKFDKFTSKEARYIDKDGVKLTREDVIYKVKKDLSELQRKIYKSENTAKTVAGLSSGIRRKGDELVNNRSKLKGVLKLLSHPVSEGLEEVEQQAAANWAGNTYQIDVDDAFEAKKDPKAIKKATNWYAKATQTFGDSVMQTINDGSTWSQFIGGALMGLTGAPVVRKMHNKKGEFQSPFYMSGNMFSEGKAYFDQMNADNLQIEKLNKVLKDPKFKSRFESIVRSVHYQDEKDASIKEGNMVSYDQAEDKQVLSDIVMFDEVGQLDLYEEKLRKSAEDAASSPVTDKDIADAIQQTTATVVADNSETPNQNGSTANNPSPVSKKMGPFVDENGNTLPNAKEIYKKMLIDNRNKLIENIENYKKNKDIVDSNYGSMFDSDTKAKLVWLMTNQDQWNARSREYINKIVSTSGDEKLSTSDVIMNLASKQMDSYDKNSKMMSSIQNEIIQLTLARDTTDPQQRRAILKNYGIKEGQIAKEIDNRKAEVETLSLQLEIQGAVSNFLNEYTMASDQEKIKMLSMEFKLPSKKNEDGTEEESNEEDSYVMGYSLLKAYIKNDFDIAHATNPNAASEFCDNIDNAHKFGDAANYTNRLVQIEVINALSKMKEKEDKEKAEAEAGDKEKSEEEKEGEGPNVESEDEKISQQTIDNGVNDVVSIILSNKTYEDKKTAITSYLDGVDNDKLKSSVISGLMNNDQYRKFVEQYVMFDEMRRRLYDKKPTLTSPEVKDIYDKLLTNVIKNSNTIFEVSNAVASLKKDPSWSDNDFANAKNILDVFVNTAKAEVQNVVMKYQGVQKKAPNIFAGSSLSDDNMQLLLDSLGFDKSNTSNIYDFAVDLQDRCDKNKIHIGTATNAINYVIKTIDGLTQTLDNSVSSEDFKKNVLDALKNTHSYKTLSTLYGDSIDKFVDTVIDKSMIDNINFESIQRILDSNPEGSQTKDIVDAIFNYIITYNNGKQNVDDKLNYTKNDIYSILSGLTSAIRKMANGVDKDGNKYDLKHIINNIKYRKNDENGISGEYTNADFSELMFLKSKAQDVSNSVSEVDELFNKVILAMNQCASQSIKESETSSNDKIDGFDDPQSDPEVDANGDPISPDGEEITEDGTIASNTKTEDEAKADAKENTQLSIESSNAADKVGSNGLYNFNQSAIPQLDIYKKEKGELVSFATTNPAYANNGLFASINFAAISTMSLGTDVYFIIDKEFESKKDPKDPYSKVPTVFIAIKDKSGTYIKIGATPRANEEKYNGLVDMHEDIKNEYVKSELSKDNVTSGIFVYSKSCKPQNILPGLFDPYINDVSGSRKFTILQIDDIHHFGDSDDKKIGLMVLTDQKGTNKNSLNISDDQIWNKKNEKKVGIYLLVPNGYKNGKQMYSMIYTKQRRFSKSVTAKYISYFTTNFHTIYSNQTASSQSKIAGYIYKAIDEAAEKFMNQKTTQIAGDDLVKELKKYLYFGCQISFSYKVSSSGTAYIRITSQKNGKLSFEDIFIKNDKGETKTKEEIASEIFQHLPKSRMNVSTDCINGFMNGNDKVSADEYVQDILSSGCLMVDVNPFSLLDQRPILQYYDKSGADGTFFKSSKEAKTAKVSNSTKSNSVSVDGNGRTIIKVGENEYTCKTNNDHSISIINNKTNKEVSSDIRKSNFGLYYVMSALVDCGGSLQTLNNVFIDKNHNYIDLENMCLANEKQIQEYNNTAGITVDVESNKKESLEALATIKELNNGVKTANESEDGLYHVGDDKFNRTHSFIKSSATRISEDSIYNKVAEILLAGNPKASDFSTRLDVLAPKYPGINKCGLTINSTKEQIKAALDAHSFDSKVALIGTEADDIARQAIDLYKSALKAHNGDKNETLKELQDNNWQALREGLDLSSKKAIVKDSPALLSLFKYSSSDGTMHSGAIAKIIEDMVSGDETYISDRTVVYGKIDGTLVAGELDLLSIDSNGFLVIKDFKTSKKYNNQWSFMSGFKNDDSLFENYTYQLNIYRMLIEQMTGVKINGIKLLAIQKKDSDVTTSGFGAEEEIRVPLLSDSWVASRVNYNSKYANKINPTENKGITPAGAKEIQQQLNDAAGIDKVVSEALNYKYDSDKVTVEQANEFTTKANKIIKAAIKANHITNDVIDLLNKAYAYEICAYVNKNIDLQGLSLIDNLDVAQHYEHELLPEISAIMQSYEHKRKLSKSFNGISLSKTILKELDSSINKFNSNVKLEIASKPLSDNESNPIGNETTEAQTEAGGTETNTTDMQASDNNDPFASVSLGNEVEEKPQQTETNKSEEKKESNVKPNKKQSSKSKKTSKLNRNKPGLARQQTTDAYEVWDESKEMAWLEKVLPNLSSSDRVKVKDILNGVASNGTRAWGMFIDGVMYIRKDAAVGTLYHEAFHAVFHLLTTSNEQAKLFSLARQQYGNVDDLTLEENMANDFMDYKMDKDDNIIHKATSFIENIFDRILEFLGFTKSMDIESLKQFYRHIDGGFMSQRDCGLTTIEESRNMDKASESISNKSRFESLSKQEQEGLSEKGFTKKAFDSMPFEMQENEIKCMGF